MEAEDKELKQRQEESGINEMIDEYDPFEDGIDVIGFSQKSEFAYLFSNYSNRSFFLLSRGKVDEAMNFFYNVLGDFAVVFDYQFLNNCIKIKNDILNKENGESVNKKDYLKMYHLHKAQFSRLMIRANVCLQPDIHDNRFPDYEPAQKPGGF